MSLLNNFPHTAVAKIRQRSRDNLGGSKDVFATLASWRSGVACWQQAARESEIREFDKRGISVTDKIYFTTRPDLDERHTLTVTNPKTGTVNTYEVRSHAEPDATAGLGVVYRVMAEYKTTEQAHEAVTAGTVVAASGTAGGSVSVASTFRRLEMGNVSGTGTINLSPYSVRDIEVTLTLIGDYSFSFSNPDAAAWITMVVSQDGTGYHELSFPSLEGGTPAIELEPDSTTVVFIYYDGQGTYYFDQR